MDQIYREIEEETDRIAGTNKGICPQEIGLKVYSPTAYDLTLVDLPGVTKNPVGDQPEDIEEQIISLVQKYIKSELTIILAVVTANVDMAACESLKIAKAADPEKNRTLAVVTKIDLMDEGTDARDILTGSVIPVKLGIIGVKNRSQKDIDAKKSIEDALADEEKFFKQCYPDLASRNGVPYLAKALSTLLREHIRKNLPSRKDAVAREIEKSREVLTACGYTIKDERLALGSIISELSYSFSKMLDGIDVDVEATELRGGAKICYILHSHLEKRLATIHPCQSYCQEKVLMGIRNSNGPRPPLIVAEPAFQALVKPQLQKMLEPALHSVELTAEELISGCTACLPTNMMKRFPLLRSEIIKAVKKLVRQNAKQASALIEQLVEIEVEHITYTQLQSLKEEFAELLDQENDGSSEPLPFQSDYVFMREISNKKVMSRDGDIAPAAELLLMSKQDRKHVRVLGKMLDHYFSLVAKNFQDSVAKSIMCYLVNRVKRGLSNHLTDLLYRDDIISRVFEETEDTTYMRLEHEKKLETLEDAYQILSDALDGYC